MKVEDPKFKSGIGGKGIWIFTISAIGMILMNLVILNFSFACLLRTLLSMDIQCAVKI